ncbi:putative holin [Pandoraea apista]|uniref:putative holin n=1 Tax=Pandoraea apista TaxID=93218 RepID=UPI000F67A782|nr:putative holin [Pandoraea apista]RRW87920.1 hypothetical protein EGJ54_25185 [Pandoraea apista]RRW96277.1 hypothetical protein EGJ56_25050 [Pandoraea apista]
MLTTSTVASVVAGAASGATLAALWPQTDLVVFSGVLCGALIFALRSQETSRLKKILYFCISLVGGYAVTPSLEMAAPWLPAWPAAFFSAALVVTLAMVLLSWVETALPQALTQLINKMIGGGK